MIPHADRGKGFAIVAPTQVQSLTAAPPWRGSAVAGYAAFPFDSLPWAELGGKKKRKERVHLVKEGRSRKVFRIEDHPAPGGHGTETLFAKRYLVNTLRRQIGNRLAGSKAERELALGLELRRAGIPTPAPLACAVHLSSVARQPGGEILPPASYLLTREWPNEGSALDWVRFHPGQAEVFWALLARFLAHAHDRGFYHDDLSSEHLLVARDLDPARADPASPRTPPFAFIDIDNGRLFPAPIEMSLRVVNVFQIFRSMTFRRFPREQRARFVAEYLAAAGLAHCESAFLRDLDRVSRRKAGKSVL